MDKQQVADTLEEIGRMLELLGENPFKVRAYDNAARIVRGLDRDLEQLVAARELTEIRGIGEALADAITSLVETGRSHYLDELRRSVPGGLLEWLKIPGLGAKKARTIHLALGIAEPDELEQACKDNRVRELEGFGERSQQKILQGLQRVRRRAGRFLQPLVRAEARRLLEIVRASDGVLRAEVGGSVRRRVETSKDIDVVVAASAADPVMEAFAGAEGVEQVTGRGPTKCSVRLARGPAADLRVVDDRSFPFALLYFTGSKAHNIALRGLAARRGYKLNEYELLREATGRRARCADEADIYRRLGLRYIEPELREDTGEIEAASRGALPELLGSDDLCGVLHCHSSWSDGRATIRELADAARAMGLAYLGLSDHSQAAAYAGGLDAARVRRQHAEIDALNASCDGGFRVLKGIEVDILPDGRLDYPDELLAEFELVIAAVHSRLELDQAGQTRRLLRALDNPYVDVLGHVTGRLLLARDPYPLDLTRVLDRAADRGVAVELNAHPSRLDPDWSSLRYGLRRGLKTCINPDAHSTEDLRNLELGVGIARKAWCSREEVLNAWPLERLLEHLRTRRRDAGA